MTKEQILELASLHSRLTTQYYTLYKMQKIKEEIEHKRTISSK